MTSVPAGHIILTPIQPVGSGWPQRESNQGPPLPTELPRRHKVLVSVIISIHIEKWRSARLVREILSLNYFQLFGSQEVEHFTRQHN